MKSAVHTFHPIALAALLALSGCGGSDDDAPVDTTTALQTKVQNIVVIYAENRSFDNLFGNFPGANGLSAVVDASGKPTSAYVPQKDRDGATVLTTLPQTWGGVTAAGVSPVVTQAQSAGLPNQPFQVETAFKASANATLSTATNTATSITGSTRTRCRSTAAPTTCTPHGPTPAA